MEAGDERRGGGARGEGCTQGEVHGAGGGMHGGRGCAEGDECRRWTRRGEGGPCAQRETPLSAHLYRGCSDVSEGDRSGMDRDVDDRVVAMEAVVASSKEGGVQGRRSGRPVGTRWWAPAGARPPRPPCEDSRLHLQLHSPPPPTPPAPTCHPTLRSPWEL